MFLSLRLITVLEDILRQNGYGIIVCDSRTDEERQKDAIEFLLSKMVDGIVMMPVGNDSKCLKPALDKKLPVVLVDRTIPSFGKSGRGGHGGQPRNC